MASSHDRFGPALEWIVGHLDAEAVPYQVVGGLAAIAYGSSRPLNDIDLYAPLADNHSLIRLLDEHTIWGPEHQQDDFWDLVFMKLQFNGVRIEIGDTSSRPRYFDQKTSSWIDQAIDFRTSQRLHVFGVEVSVMPLEQLISYKQALCRPVDLEDVRELTGR